MTEPDNLLLSIEDKIDDILERFYDYANAYSARDVEEVLDKDEAKKEILKSFETQHLKDQEDCQKRIREVRELLRRMIAKHGYWGLQPSLADKIEQALKAKIKEE